MIFNWLKHKRQNEKYTQYSFAFTERTTFGNAAFCNFLDYPFLRWVQSLWGATFARLEGGLSRNSTAVTAEEPHSSIHQVGKRFLIK